MRALLSRLSALEDRVSRFLLSTPLAPENEAEPQCDHIVAVYDHGNGPEAMYWCWAGDLLYPDVTMFVFCPLCGEKL